MSKTIAFQGFSLGNFDGPWENQNPKVEWTIYGYFSEGVRLKLDFAVLMRWDIPTDSLSSLLVIVFHIFYHFTV